MQPDRLPTGGRIDRSRPLAFRFNGRNLQGYHGDTLASALLANGIRIIGRSFKYHRRRGIMGIGAEEPNAIVQVGTGADTIPGLRATEVELYDGLVATTARGWPGLNSDLLAINDFLSPLLGAGVLLQDLHGAPVAVALVRTRPQTCFRPGCLPPSGRPGSL